MKFTKMHGLGNDYVYLDCTESGPGDLPGLARRMSDRHFGVGADGLICIRTSERADFRMEMYNADGSEGEMCGNGIRCMGKFLYDKGLTDQTELTIETLAGKRLWSSMWREAPSSLSAWTWESPSSRRSASRCWAPERASFPGASW